MARPRGIKSENKKEYDIWRSMLQRVENKKGTNPTYAHVRLCERWESFENFLADMGKRPGPEYSLDRVDNGGDYEPGNCRWATLMDQNHNKSNNLWITINGETKVLAEWARESGIAHGVIARRINAGWPENRWLENPRKSEKIIHPKEKDAWEKMIDRYPENVCQQWKESFDSFYAEVGPTPGPEYGISRINKNLDYEPGNCKWATKSERSQRPSKRIITKNGISKTVSEWAAELGIPEGTINSRIYKIGWPESMWLDPVLPKRKR